MSQTAVLRHGLREAVRELQETRNKLLELQKTIPPAPPESREDDCDADPDPAPGNGSRHPVRAA